MSEIPDYWETLERVKNEPSGAVLDLDQVYRYYLWRTWSPSRESMIFVMLNPSTADAEVDDPTIRRCVNFAKREGCGGIGVLNLFAYRATQPDDLLRTDDPKGPLNKQYVEWVISGATGPLVAAWGTWWHSNQTRRYGQSIPRLSVEAIAKQNNKRMWCLGFTKDRQPRHPLYVSSSQPLVVFS